MNSLYIKAIIKIFSFQTFITIEFIFEILFSFKCNESINSFIKAKIKLIIIISFVEIENMIFDFLKIFLANSKPQCR